MLIASCAKSLPAPVVVDTACSWVRVIYLTDHDIDVLDMQTKRDILAHNISVQANCGKVKKEMNTNNVNAASILYEKLKELEGQYSLVERGEGLGIMIQSRYQDDDFVNAVRRSVTGELSRRIGAVKHQLTELGVTSFTKEQ